RQVFADVIENLRPLVARHGPPAAGFVRGLYGVADVLAVAFAHFTYQPAAGPVDAAGVAAVGPGLPAADVHFRRAVDARRLAGGLGPVRVGPGAGRTVGRRPRGRRFAVGRARRTGRTGRTGRAARAGRRGAALPRGPQILEHALPAAFAPEAALFVPAEARGRVKQIGGVDPHYACLHLGGHVQGQVDVFRPDAGGQAVGRVVGQLHRLDGRAERHADQHRAENFHLGHGRCRRHAGQERGRVEAARLGLGPRRLPQHGAFLLAFGDQLFNALQLHRRDDGAHVDGFVQRIANAQRFHAPLQLLDERALHGLLHQQAR